MRIFSRPGLGLNSSSLVQEAAQVGSFALVGPYIDKAFKSMFPKEKIERNEYADLSHLQTFIEGSEKKLKKTDSLFPFWGLVPKTKQQKPITMLKKEGLNLDIKNHFGSIMGHDAQARKEFLHYKTGECEIVGAFARITLMREKWNVLVFVTTQHC
jgi:hypothetical protein